MKKTFNLKNDAAARGVLLVAHRGVWGWLADCGYDFIQTDWLLACDQFLSRTGRRRP